MAYHYHTPRGSLERRAQGLGVNGANRSVSSFASPLGEVDNKSDGSSITIKANCHMPELVRKDSIVTSSNLWTEDWPGLAYPGTSSELDIPGAFGPYTSDGISGGSEAIPIEPSNDNRSSLGYHSIITVESTTTDVTTSDVGLPCPSSVQLIAHDLPPKSRVETQVKIRLEFTNIPVALPGVAAGGAARWQWLRLPFTASIKQPRYFDHDTIESESMLHLHASAICASEPYLPATCCSICYAREAKRRPKYYADPDSPTSVIDFTCEPVFDLSSGSVNLSFRMICYCRHHGEKRGFFIDFTVKDSHGCVVGSTRTTPILITDDRRPIISVASVSSPTVSVPLVPEPRLRGPRAPHKRRRTSAEPYSTYADRIAAILPDTSHLSDHHRYTLPALTMGTLHESPFPLQPSQPVYRPPSITDLLPASGPLLGGPKIAVVGSDFSREFNLGVMFGFNSSSEVTCRSADLIICKLPPSPVPGAVRVLLTSDVPLPPTAPLIFTYTDTREQDLMGMALQVLGMQRSGMKLDPMDVARSILSIGQTGEPDGTYATGIENMYPSVGFQQLLLDGYEDWKINLENRLLILLQDCYEDAEEAQWRDWIATENAHGQTMLHLAASLGFKCLTSALLDWDMDVNATDINGLTPLHFACIFRHGDCARMLLDYDADPNVADDWGRSSWDLGELADNSSDAEDSQPEDGPDVEDGFVSDAGYSSAVSGKSFFRKSFHKSWFKTSGINVTSLTSTPTSIDSSLPSLPDTSPVLKSIAHQCVSWMEESPPAYSSIQALAEESDEKDLGVEKEDLIFLNIGHPPKRISIKTVERALSEFTKAQHSALGLFNTQVQI